MQILAIELLLCFSLSACTISVTTVNNHGSGSDVVDETQKADAQVSPDISIPLATCDDSEIYHLDDDISCYLADYDYGGRDVGLHSLT